MRAGTKKRKNVIRFPEPVDRLLARKKIRFPHVEYWIAQALEEDDGDLGRPNWDYWDGPFEHLSDAREELCEYGDIPGDYFLVKTVTKRVKG